MLVIHRTYIRAHAYTEVHIYKCCLYLAPQDGSVRKKRGAWCAVTRMAHACTISTIVYFNLAHANVFLLFSMCVACMC